MPFEYGMEPLIHDDTTESRLTGLEKFLERYLGPRRPEYGFSVEEVRTIQMPVPLQRFFQFAGRWPGSSAGHPCRSRFSNQDSLGSLVKGAGDSELRILDNALVFVQENQACWVAATDRVGADPPVWITEEFTSKEILKQWKRLERPLSHFLVSFVMQELLFGSPAALAVVPYAMEKFEAASLRIEPVWLKGEYRFDCDRPSYYLVGEHILVRRALDDANGEDWYGCETASGAEMLRALGMPTKME